MQLNKGQIRSFLAWTFGKVRSSTFLAWVARWVPQVSAVIDLLEKKADAETEALAAPLPEVFTPSELVTVLFQLAEGWFPTYTQQLEAIKIAVLMVLAFLPATMQGSATPTSVGELRTYLDGAENRIINAGWAASAFIGPTDKLVAQGVKVFFQQQDAAKMQQLLSFIPHG